MKSRRVICIYTCMYSWVLENCFPPTLFFCNVCGGVWLTQNNQGCILIRRGHRPGNAGAGICSVRLMPLHCSSWLCFRCIILLLTHHRHLFGYVKSNTSAFSKNKNQQQQNPKHNRVSTERVNVQEISKGDVSNCALTDRQVLISEPCGKCTCSRVQKILADASYNSYYIYIGRHILSLIARQHMNIY